LKRARFAQLANPPFIAAGFLFAPKAASPGQNSRPSGPPSGFVIAWRESRRRDLL